MRRNERSSTLTNYPGGSKTRVNRAGDSVRAGTPSNEDLSIIEEWRRAHRGVLNTFQSILRGRARGTAVTVAQRHKRRRTIFDKLARFPNMQLARMDDVAGCRLIFATEAELTAFRSHFHRAPFNHRMRNAPEKYDYIASPKASGYRGIHDVYEYDVQSSVGQGLRGLYVEIQYRTRVQHSWATAVELIGFITESEPKFQRGDARFEDAMVFASEILARAHEERRGPIPELSNRDLVQRFLRLEKELGLLAMLKGLNAADQAASDMRNFLLIMRGGQRLEVRPFRDAPEALRTLFAIEQSEPEADVVLVRADTTDDIREAFKNYFSDARDFIRLVEEGCARLSGKAITRRRVVRRKATKRSARKRK